MAHTVTMTTLLDGKRNVVLLGNIVSDGASADLAASVLVNRGAFASDDGSEFVLERFQGVFIGFTASLLFAASANLVFLRTNANPVLYDYTQFGGISSNKAGAGATGNILITTVGLNVAGAVATFVLELRKN